MSFNRLVFALVLAPFVAACTVAPGMSFSGASRVGAAGAATPLAVVPITASLIEEQAALDTASITEAELRSLSGRSEKYRIGPADVLSIVVWDHPELVLPSLSYALVGANSTSTVTGLPQQTIPGFVVDGDGLIQFPYVGLFNVVGKTVAEAQRALSVALQPYISKPQVTLRVIDFRSKRVYVDGEVRAAGVKQITDVSMSLAEAISQAGGIPASGDASNIVLSRDGAQYSLGIPQMIAAGLSPTQFVLRNNDVLKVASRDETKVFVVGEVTHPVSLAMHDGKLSLNEALGEAGGVNVATSDAKSVFVIRATSVASSPSVFQLDARSPVALALAERFQLQAKDVVYVDATGLTRIDRVVGQLLTGSGVAFNLAH